ncbi:MAG: hypothetical protein A2504_05410 [Bdellovibrionales bacterium RIFOXYD12_FULL_39_22]|nr:MAG: hypothetical protein A2385_06415 [Bdellovibrionales bacterium RIFOXYB1_FULL_39_21]OFZ41911.1 MAG: hypothetical protein A2485_08385 [Bdellovibrionales bacterium RIFOXYC12_FULL_39_17]OFZ50627.1 MAG: hypothetical protein A2404_05335 [Bdellovibrionales bacterium RIFOXYC1_FULL_39_130]OFZ77850.1 MAG: hypothetical protein A2560_00505 [Bdellovibrionales bacterium RIFOXYD1_FULL_39_84]OFZ93714.1 MAG: hypothetical protein A2504_05410 [Bdellovibrionales bacterium RIFOXYD12_FULL_39_22]HLE11603.1 XR
MRKNTKYSSITAHNSEEIAVALGIASEVDRAFIKYKVKLSSMAVRAISNSNLTVKEIVVKSGVARSKVSAIKNGALAGISCDLFIKVITATGAKLSFKMAA